MYFKCGTCCRGCTVCSDDFNRTVGDTVGNDWYEDVGDWDIVATASGEGALQNTNYPATLTREVGCGTDPASHTITIDYLGTPTPFPRSSSVTVKWTPLNTYDPSTHRLYLGNRNATPGAIDDGIFVQVKYYVAVTASIRLGNRVAGVDTWLTDELTIGDRTPTYAGSSSWVSGEPQFQVTLCWEPVEFYFGVEMYRSYRKVAASISTPTTAVYTLEAMAINACDMIPQIEAVDGYARWDDLVWSITKPDAAKCPYCGSCTFAADMTTVDDLGTWAYTSSGGTFARNASGDLELTSTTATWIVDLPTRVSFSMSYVADWVGSSPTMTVEVGGIQLSFSKSLTPEQVVAVTVGGSGATSIYAPISSSTLSICFTGEKIVVVVGTSRQEYDYTDPGGTTNVVLSAGSTIVTVSELVALRSSDDSVAGLGCIPCDVDTPVDCSVCPPDAFAPYGAMVITASVDITWESRLGFVSTGGFSVDVGDPCPDSTTAPLYTDPKTIFCGGEDYPPDTLADNPSSGADPALSYLRKDGTDTALCTFTYYQDFCSCVFGSADYVGIRAGMVVVLYETAGGEFYLAASPTYSEDWPCGGTFTTWVTYDCIGGLVTPIEVDVTAYGNTGPTAELLGHWNESLIDNVVWRSENFTDCDKVDFTLTGTAVTVRHLFSTINYPANITIHVPR